MLLERSEQINELAAALAKIQGKVQPATKDRVNPFFNSRYATLDSVWETCRELLEMNEVSVVQLPFYENGVVVLEQMLMHSSGQWIGSRLHLRPEKDTPQSVGSAITYARRYLLGAALGITTDEDDDGNAATQNQTKATKNGNGKLSPGYLLSNLNKVTRISGFYPDTKSILSALKRDDWPPSDDQEGWRQLYKDARDCALEEIQAFEDEQNRDFTPDESPYLLPDTDGMANLS